MAGEFRAAVEKFIVDMPVTTDPFYYLIIICQGYTHFPRLSFSNTPKTSGLKATNRGSVLLAAKANKYE